MKSLFSIEGTAKTSKQDKNPPVITLFSGSQRKKQYALMKH